MERRLLYGFDGDTPALLDPMDARRTAAGEPNSTEILVAPPGSGKSGRLKHLALWSLLLGYDVTVFDLEGEYDPLCARFAAHCREAVAGAADSATNPLALALDAAGEGVEDARRANPVRGQVAAMLGVLEAMHRRALTDDELAAGDDALMRTYHATWTRSDGVACGGIDPEQPATWTRPAPWLACLAEVLDGMGDDVATRLGRVVRRHTTGSLGGLFAETTRLRFDRPLVRFDYRGLAKQTWPLAMYLSVLALWQAQLARPREHVVLLEESMQLFKQPECGEQLEVIGRRGRKWKLKPIYVFHTAADFTQSAHADVVRQCASIHQVLRQNEQSIDGVAALYHFSAADRQFALTCGLGDAILFARGTRAHVTLDLLGSPEEPLVLTGLQAG